MASADLFRYGIDTLMELQHIEIWPGITTAGYNRHAANDGRSKCRTLYKDVT